MQQVLWNQEIQFRLRGKRHSLVAFLALVLLSSASWTAGGLASDSVGYVLHLHTMVFCRRSETKIAVVTNLDLETLRGEEKASVSNSEA
jgi:hypothetical protein